MVRLLPIVAGCLFSFGCGSSGTEYQRSGTPTLKLEVRRASTETVEGWESTTWQATAASPETLFVSPNVEFSNEDVVSTGVQSDDYGLWQVILRLNDPARKQFAEMSAELADAESVQATGTPSKRLAVLVDEKVTFAPWVREPISDGVLRLGHAQLTEQEARRIAKGIVGH